MARVLSDLHRTSGPRDLEYSPTPPEVTILHHIVSDGMPCEIWVRALNLGKRGFDRVMNQARNGRL